MDILSIPSINNLAAEAYGQKAAEAKNGRARQEENGNEVNGDTSRQLTASDIHNPKRLKEPQAYGLHGLDSKEAWSLLSGLAPEIAKQHPSSLAELQPVTEGNLIPAAYV